MKLVVENLTCRRGLRTIFSDLSFSVEGGQGLLLTGANGSGKTTLLRMLAGYLEASSGEVRLEGGDDELELAEQYHYVGHHNGIKHSFTALENLQFLADYLGGDNFRDAIDTFGLRGLEDIPAAIMSAGQKRRLGLSRLVLVKRPIWFLDEPSVSLDVQSVQILAGVVSRHIENGGIVIAATHVPLGVDFKDELVLGW
ncbi:MAG: heme ABC exporter ATP-binding protein CcmA [bacterium]|nr:heme ABC exporter ATP-binding protein CcmA [bacterium]